MPTNVPLRVMDLCVLVGPSGSGKTTLIKRLIKEFPTAFGYSVSHTTRAPREGEVDGLSYNFVQPEQFAALVEQGRFLEHATVHNTSYGTSDMSVSKVLATNKIVCMDLDIVGAQSLRRNGRFKSLILFVETPGIEELRRRLVKRGTETEERLAVRLENARKEIQWFHENTSFFDGRVLNDDIDMCYPVFRQTVLTACFPEGLGADEHAPWEEGRTQSR